MHYNFFSKINLNGITFLNIFPTCFVFLGKENITTFESEQPC